MSLNNICCLFKEVDFGRLPVFEDSKTGIETRVVPQATAEERARLLCGGVRPACGVTAARPYDPGRGGEQ